MKTKLLSLGLCALVLTACNSKNEEKKKASDAEKTYQLVWTDEFDAPGLPDADKWFLETDAPENGGWYNNEKQHYTDRIENAEVSDGTLKLLLKRSLTPIMEVHRNLPLPGLILNFTSLMAK
ncbi:hypothetical protein OAB12_05595 [Flavobacteriaceae bacterium]|nr:hypothetical protein [Flavobacteriaceae bacterium]